MHLIDRVALHCLVSDYRLYIVLRFIIHNDRQWRGMSQSLLVSGRFMIWG
jgi:hypothetical protein